MIERRSGRERRTGHRTGVNVERRAKATTPVESYWLGCTREELMAAIKLRRAQQRIPTERELLFDPAASATVALQQDHKWAEVRK